MKYWIGRFVLWMFGWKIGEEPPKLDKYVLIAAPHTSGWDFVFMMAFAWVFRMKVSWMGKHTLFKGPFGWLMRWMGGIPVYRDKRQDLVSQLVEAFASREQMVLAVPAAGTRSYREYWKSGFYYIAQGAGVPIIPGYLDYKRRIGGFGPPLMPSGDFQADMDILRAFYQDKEAKYPELMSRIRLRQEDEQSPPAEGENPS